MNKRKQTAQLGFSRKINGDLRVDDMKIILRFVIESKIMKGIVMKWK